MGVGMVYDTTAWAESQFGTCCLGDIRRTRRAVVMGSAIMRHPSASLPQQMASTKALKAAYRLLAEGDVTYTALISPHWQQTRHMAKQERLVLMVQDTTELDYTHHPATAGLGPLGNGTTAGLLMNTVLAITPQPRQVLGIAYQEPFLRQEVPKGETRHQRKKRLKETDVWMRGVKAIGSPPEESVWIHIGDRTSDLFDFMHTCRQTKCHFLVRAAQNRRVQDADRHVTHLFELAASLPTRGEEILELPARRDRPARQARVQISFGSLTIMPTQYTSNKSSIEAWIVRVWEPDPPPGMEPLEWVLITSVPTETVDQAWERVLWYRCRWLVEDFHQCLKTGCRVEERQLQTGERLQRLLGFLSPVAVQLLQLRESARLTPDQLATTTLPRELVVLVAHLAEMSPETLTVKGFWRQVARLGGYLGRKGDGPPGWKTLWRGWLHIQTLMEGVRLASQLPP
jgi:hypothetical protein